MRKGAFERTRHVRTRNKASDQGTTRSGRKPIGSRSTIGKAFGDAIAFLYCDRFALKHVYYNTHNVNVRQDGGFISGSAGFEQEFDILRKLVEGGCPCVLCDLTNTIRYGDICVMVEDDPILIEVKASRTKNRRRARQLKNLKTLREFYKTDASSGLRGFPSVYRIATRSVPYSFEEELNECIEESYERDYALKSPEPGVCYVAISGEVRVEEVFGQVNLTEPLWFSLNEAKRDRAWSPYYPFTLLIRSERALYDFMLGRLFVMVLLDVAVIRNLVRTLGWIPKFDWESNYPVWASRERRRGTGRTFGACAGTGSHGSVVVEVGCGRGSSRTRTIGPLAGQDRSDMQFRPDVNPSKIVHREALEHRCDRGKPT